MQHLDFWNTAQTLKIFASVKFSQNQMMKPIVIDFYSGCAIKMAYRWWSDMYPFSYKLIDTAIMAVPTNKGIQASIKKFGKQGKVGLQ